MQSGLSHVVSTIQEEETNNSSLVASLRPPLPPVPIKTPQMPPPIVITPEPTIATAAVGTLADAFPDLYTKVQLNIILNRKLKSPICLSDATSLEGIYNLSDLPNEHISALVSALFNSIDMPMDDPK